jgi:hypothetical protein
MELMSVKNFHLSMLKLFQEWVERRIKESDGGGKFNHDRL